MSPPNSGARVVTWNEFHTEDAKFRTEPWTSLSFGARELIHAVIRRGVGIAINTLKMSRRPHKKCCPAVQASGYACSAKPYDRTDAPTARGKISLTRGFHCCPNFLISFLPDQRLHIVKNVCIYTYLSAYWQYTNCRCYQTTLQWNIFTQIGAMRRVDWIFIVGAPGWWWLGEYVILDRTFYSLLLQQNVVAATVTATFSSLSHSSRRPLLEIYDYTMN
jgi:hypothetical protein